MELSPSPMFSARTAAAAVLTLGLGFGLASCDSEQPESTQEPAASSSAPGAASASAAPSTTPSEEAPVPVDRRQLAASVLMPPAVNYDDALAKLQAGAGGIFIPSWADPALLSEPGRDINALRAAVGRDFQVSIDFEGGRVQRFSEILGEHPAPAQMAAEHSPEEVEQMGAEIGRVLKEHGINVDFAPVLDVDGGELEVVGDRSFSTDPKLAGEYGAAFARGLESAGVKAVFKHFPGHGRASGDTHLGEAVTPPLEELYGHEFVPFQEAIPAAPAAGLMMGHLVVPGLGDGQTPASINPAAYQLAREQLHYGGPIYTDDIGGMASIADTMNVPQAVVAALASGADMPLWSTDAEFPAAVDAVVAALDDGTLTDAQLQASAQGLTGGKLPE